MMIGVKLLFLILVIGQSAVGKFKNFGYKRYETSIKTTRFDKATSTESILQTTETPIVNKTIDNENSKIFSKNVTSQQNHHNISNQTLMEALREVKTCKERYISVRRIRAEFGGNSNVSVFQCNITKELVDGLKDKLHQLEIFQGVLVLYPKNDWSNTDRLSGSNAPDKIQNHQGNFSSQGGSENAMKRPERDVLLKNDQIESNTKVSQLSHIYLGRSLYPFFTEESRIIDKDRTLPPPVYTEPTYIDANKNLTTDEK